MLKQGSGACKHLDGLTLDCLWLSKLNLFSLRGRMLTFLQKTDKKTQWNSSTRVSMFVVLHSAFGGLIENLFHRSYRNCNSCGAWQVFSYAGLPEEELQARHLSVFSHMRNLATLLPSQSNVKFLGYFLSKFENLLEKSNNIGYSGFVFWLLLKLYVPRGQPQVVAS